MGGVEWLGCKNLLCPFSADCVQNIRAGRHLGRLLRVPTLWLGKSAWHECCVQEGQVPSAHFAVGRAAPLLQRHPLGLRRVAQLLHAHVDGDADVSGFRGRRHILLDLEFKEMGRGV